MEKITGIIQNYDWGGKRFIADLLQQEPKYPVQAEYWLGAHENSPSVLENGKNLADFIHQHPQVLSENSQKRFGQKIPFLLKILDVAKPLSIQVHPSKSQAEQGFVLEEAQGIPRHAPNRTYKDDNHKPEMMIALSDFWLLHSFKSQSALLETFHQYPSLQGLIPILEEKGIRGLYETLLFAEQSALSRWLTPMLDVPQPESALSPDYWLHETMHLMEIPRDKLDAGLMSFYVMNIVQLQKGEGIFQAAGLPHAYLRGQNIELMACSDNVVRGGLTPKYIDKSALLQIMDFTPITPNIIAPAPNDDYVYPIPETDFVLRRQQFEKEQSALVWFQEFSIVLVMEGEIQIHEQILSRGQSAFFAAGESVSITALEKSWWVVAS